MNTARRVLMSAGDQIKHSFLDRLFQRLEDALQEGTEVKFRLTWGNLTGIPIYLDPTCVEIVSVNVYVEDDDEPSEEISWRTVWLIRLEEINAIAYLSESWSKGRFEQLLGHEDGASEEKEER
ncbi:MAG: hypothetical protein AAFV72_09205 [Cyanobacteria bacterium J06635_1]